MTMTDTQRTEVASWVGAGMKLAEIQRRLNSDLGLNLTYMEVRFLVDDLKLTLKDPEPPKELPPTPSATPSLLSPTSAAPPPSSTSSILGGIPPTDPTASPVPLPAGGPAAPGTGVSVTVDQVTRPGTLVSGSVRFSDGQVATWYLDQAGRLGLAPTQKGYRPPPADVEEFQLALERELARMGL